jgi:hypothetical protein
MPHEKDALNRLKQDVLDRSPSAALPSNLSEHWLDVALYEVERVINANGDTDSNSLRIPLSLVMHLLSSKMLTGPLELSDEQLFYCIKAYRFELAMEKLRRLGVQLAIPATERTIFRPESFPER